MSIRHRAERRETERMSDTTYRWMMRVFDVVDFFLPHVPERVQGFGITEGMTVVDYGCGPGRYATEFAKLVGESGKVYAVDIHEMGIEAVRQKIEERGITNIEPVLVSGYDSGLPDGVADVVCAIDMFFVIKEPTAFLDELKRITKPGGMLVIDDGHQPRSVTIEKIRASGHWDIVAETRDHLKCRPRRS